MALRQVVATLLIACFIFFHVECAPSRIGRDDDSRFENGSGYEDPGAVDNDEYNDVGADDPDDSYEEDPDTESSQPAHPGNPIDDDGIEASKTTAAPISTVNVDDANANEDEDLGSEEEDDAYEEYEDYDASENGFVSIQNNNNGTGLEEKPLIDKNPKNDNDVVVDLGLGEDGRSSDKPNERDMFFGKPDTAKPEVAATDAGLVGIGVQKTDVMIFFDEDDDYDDSQMEEDPEVVSLERGDYKKDDFFDTIGMKKLDDFIPKATETKKAQEFIEGRSTVIDDMNDIFGERKGSKTMKDDFFDSIAVKNVVTGEVDLKLQTSKADNQVRASVAKIDTHGPEGGMSFEEELKMHRLILKALQSFMGSPCLIGDRHRRVAKCAVLQDVLEALTLSGTTFNGEKKNLKPKTIAESSKKNSRTRDREVAPHVVFGK